MNKYVVIMLSLTILISPLGAQSKVIRAISSLQNYDSAYSDDIVLVEEYLFGGSYHNDTIPSRLARIERKLFGRCYPTMSAAQRMNNILANYREDYNDRNYLSDYYGVNRNPAQRILNRFLGQPTGFTPPVMNLPFNDYGRPYGINRSLYNNRGGYIYNNETPANTGIGIHILED